MPWWTPPAIKWIVDRYSLFKDARVIELGSGGSTAFFSDMCAHVTTIETDPAWAERVRDLRMPNVNVMTWCPREDASLEALLRSRKFNVALVDGDPAQYSRGKAAAILLPLMEQSAVFITDNYFLPDNLVKEFTVPTEWEHHDFNDKHWHGCGTRISVRNSIG